MTGGAPGRGTVPVCRLRAIHACVVTSVCQGCYSVASFHFVALYSILTSELAAFMCPLLAAAGHRVVKTPESNR